MSFVPLNDMPVFAGYEITDLHCSICDDDFMQGEIAFAHAGSNVPHPFHLACITSWMETSASCPMCRFLVTHVNGEPTEALRRAAAQQREADEAQLEQQREAEEAERALLAQELYAASSNGDLARVEELLALNPTSELHGTAVVHAMQNNHPDITATLFDHTNAPDEIRGWALVASAELGFHERVHEFLDDETREGLRGLAVVRASTSGHPAIIQTLLASGEIEQEQRGWALIKAAENGHAGIVNILLESGEIDREDIEKAFRQASQDLHLETISALLESGEIDEYLRGQAALEAARNGRLDIVNALLANGNISHSLRGDAVIVAAQGCRADIVEVLLASGDISAADRETALDMARDSQGDQREALIQLLENAPIQN